ncbi:hypothetical protein PspLS_11841 [Pyricularia sp. CBS 133598]|nr:hypothetical protein PspLS_11841 [Pyricularia sp. CBS 133598]
MSSTWQPTVAVDGSLKWMSVSHRWPASTQRTSISAAVLALASRSPQPSVLSRVKMPGTSPSSKPSAWPVHPAPVIMSREGLVKAGGVTLDDVEEPRVRVVEESELSMILPSYVSLRHIQLAPRLWLDITAGPSELIHSDVCNPFPGANRHG